MPPKVEKSDVEQAVARVRARGEEPGLTAVVAELGPRGSRSTVLQLLREVMADEALSRDNAECSAAFRDFWARTTAQLEKKAMAQVVIAQTDLENAVVLADTLESQIAGMAERIAGAERQRDAFLNDFAAANGQIAIERANATAQAAKLFEAREELRNNKRGQ